MGIEIDRISNKNRVNDDNVVYNQFICEYCEKIVCVNTKNCIPINKPHLVPKFIVTKRFPFNYIVELNDGDVTIITTCSYECYRHSLLNDYMVLDELLPTIN